MARYISQQNTFPLEDQLKTLGDEELLDFWEETQYLERFLEEDNAAPAEYGVEYERLILQELMVRTCMRNRLAR